MTRILAAARRGIGHRGAILLALGVFDEVYALGVPSSAVTNVATSRWLASVAPLNAWAAMWAVVGVLLIAGAFLRWDSAAFAAAMMLKVTWALLYLLGWQLHGVGRGWVGAATWTLLAVVVLVVAAWPEPQWPDA